MLLVLPEPGTPYKKNTFLYGIPNDRYSALSSSEKNSAIEFVICSLSPSFKYKVSIDLFGDNSEKNHKIILIEDIDCIK